MTIQQYTYPSSPGANGQAMISSGAAGTAAFSVGVLGNVGGGLGTTLPVQNTYTLAYHAQNGFPFTTTGGTTSYIQYSLGSSLKSVISGGTGYLVARLSGFSLLATLLAGNNIGLYLGTETVGDTANQINLTFPILGGTAVPLPIPDLMASCSTLNVGFPNYLGIYVTSSSLTGGTVTLQAALSTLLVNVSLQSS